MITIDSRSIAAGVQRCYACAADVERWPEWLPHYRWVRFLRKGEREALVEMAAWRPFGPLRWPTWWVSEMAVEPELPLIRYRHVRGITTGMDVEWDFAQRHDGTLVTITHRWTGPGWPLIGTVAAQAVIGPVFVHGIASRTLAGIARVAEAAA